jgi:predicted nucleic acid-binding Zn finger protein
MSVLLHPPERRKPYRLVVSSRLIAATFYPRERNPRLKHLNNTEFGDPFAEDPTPTAATVATPTAENKQPADRELVERAVSLFAEGGWTYKAASDTEAIFFVRSPRQELTRIVFVADGAEEGGSFCTCPDFAAEKTCVHLLAMEHELAFLAWVEEQERLIDEAEHPVYGCDPYMHYDRAGNPDTHH